MHYKIPEGTKYITQETFSYYDKKNEITNITIPDNVTSIGDYAFLNLFELESIEIPSSVTEIGEGAFAFCYKLKSITIPKGVTEIGDRVFYKCDKLKHPSIPETTELGIDIFGEMDSSEYMILKSVMHECEKV